MGRDQSTSATCGSRSAYSCLALAGHLHQVRRKATWLSISALYWIISFWTDAGDAKSIIMADIATNADRTNTAVRTIVDLLALLMSSSSLHR